MEITKEFLGVIADGVHSEFWQAIKQVLEDLREQATARMDEVNVGDMAQLSELQAFRKVPLAVISAVESMAAEYNAILEKEKKEKK